MQFHCPLCEAELASMLGEAIHPGNADYGVTLWCPSDKCPAQEVMGHGDNAKKAFDIIKDKYRLSSHD